jgi:hypothetical protein
MKEVEGIPIKELAEPITIVDRGRGPQLSNRKLTVQDLLPLFKVADRRHDAGPKARMDVGAARG